MLDNKRAIFLLFTEQGAASIAADFRWLSLAHLYCPHGLAHIPRLIPYGTEFAPQVKGSRLAKLKRITSVYNSSDVLHCAQPLPDLHFTLGRTWEKKRSVYDVIWIMWIIYAAVHLGVLKPSDPRDFFFREI